MPATLFLSCARGDDEPIVARLHVDLAASGFDVWWDCNDNVGCYIFPFSVELFAKHRNFSDGRSLSCLFNQAGQIRMHGEKRNESNKSEARYTRCMSEPYLQSSAAVY